MSPSAAIGSSTGSARGTGGTSTGSGGPQQGGPNAGRWGDVRIVHPAWEGFGRGMPPAAGGGSGGPTGGGAGGGGGVGKSKL
jgi:membrane protease subunit HflK